MIYGLFSTHIRLKHLHCIYIIWKINTPLTSTEANFTNLLTSPILSWANQSQKRLPQSSIQNRIPIFYIHSFSRAHWRVIQFCMAITLSQLRLITSIFQPEHNIDSSLFSVCTVAPAKYAFYFCVNNCKQFSKRLAASIEGIISQNDESDIIKK